MTQGFYDGGLISREFFVDVGLGKIPGFQTRAIVARNPNLGTTFEDIWGEGGTFIYPTAAESWEIVSSSPNDSSGGTGARQVLVNYLDDNYVQQSTIVTLNGTTPVALNADHFRPDGAVVIESGASEWNEGKITIQVAGGGNVRQVILPTFATSEDAFLTVPAGKQVLLLLVTPFFPKNEDGSVTGQIKAFGTNTFVTAGNFPFYQNAVPIEFKALFPLDEKSDLRYKAKSTNDGIEVNLVLEFLIADK